MGTFSVPRWHRYSQVFRLGLLSLVLLFGGTAGVRAQVPVAPAMERSEIEIVRGDDIVQPQAVFYKRVRDGEDPALVTGDSMGVLRVPPITELDALPYTDRRKGFSVNVQQAMIVADGQVIDVQVSDDVARPGARSSQGDLFVFRPPADDAFDVVVPDALDCKRLVPNSDEDQRTRGRLYGNRPCKQVPGIETVVDVATWYDASLTNSISGVRAHPGPGHTVRELRGWLRSLAPGGEQVRFAIVVVPPPRPAVASPTPIRLDTVLHSSHFTLENRIQVETVPTSGFEWITTVGVLQGPNWSGLPGRPNASPYQAHRVKGDVATVLRWQATEEQRYDLTLVGSTQPTLSSDAPGNHHDVPYGVRLGARFGERDEPGMEIELQGTFEDDPFQRNTVSKSDQRIRLLVGLDRGALPRDKTHWRLSLGPTYFRDRPNIWERRADARQLGYALDGHLTHLLRVKRFATILDAGAQLSQSWGYISDSGNRNADLSGRVSLKPRFRLASTYLALGPALHVSRTISDYAALEGFTESNVQFGLEMRSVIQF